MANISANLALNKMFQISRAPGIFYLLKALRLHLAANKLNPDLSFTVIDGYTNASDGTNSNDQVIAAAAATLYAIYLKKRTGSVASYVKFTNHATTAVTNGGADLSYCITTAAEEDLFTWPAGHAMSAGITVSQDTSGTGSTCSLLKDTCDGFVIYAL
jgi:hypothetical protein